MNAESNFEHTLACVRELSENATVRPAPKILRCVPVQANQILQPLPIWKRRYLRIAEAFAGLKHETA